MLKGKTALVTGSTSGIGRAIADKLASEGANVVLHGLGDLEQIEQQRTLLVAEFGVQATYLAADLHHPGEIEALVHNTLDHFGALDILVNNAGIQHVAPVDEFPAGKWEEIIAINLVAAYHTVRHALPAMKARGWGRVINIASAHALVASPFKSAYVAAKHGIAGFTKSVALEVAQQGVTVNAICPGYVLTPLVEKQIPDTARSRGISEEQVIRDVILAAQPTKAFVPAEQVAALAAYLASDAASAITGALLSIDGGWTAQ